MAVLDGSEKLRRRLDGINKSAGLVVRVGSRDRIDSGRASDSEIRHRGPANLSGTAGYTL